MALSESYVEMMVYLLGLTNVSTHRSTARTELNIYAETPFTRHTTV